MRTALEIQTDICRIVREYDALEKKTHDASCNPVYPCTVCAPVCGLQSLRLDEAQALLDARKVRLGASRCNCVIL